MRRSHNQDLQISIRKDLGDANRKLQELVGSQAGAMEGSWAEGCCSTMTVHPGRGGGVVALCKCNSVTELSAAQVWSGICYGVQVGGCYRQACTMVYNIARIS